VKVLPDGSSLGMVLVDGLTVASGANLDLTDNDLVVNNGNFADIQAKVIAGFANPSNITSSSSNGSQILALFDNAFIGALKWQGLDIGPSAIVGKYTYFGDANLDGQVTGDDYTIIDSNLNTTPVAGLAWVSGDMNLDGTVTGDDYTVIDSNLGLGFGNPLMASSLSHTGGIIAVPEPSVGAVMTGMCALLTHKRRRRTPLIGADGTE
jgi:hypothetical protein